MTYYIMLILFPLLLGIWAQMRVQSKYQYWAKISARSRITGAEAAEAVLQQAGINDVEIVEIPGQLTDHYDPVHKRLALSSSNYRGTSLAALGVSAHEAGHAIQHKQAYAPLKLRSALVPITNIACQILPWIIISSIFFNFMGWIKFAVIIYLILAIFQLVTLPVEFDASARAKRVLEQLSIVDRDESVGVCETLDAAAWTYVAAFVASLGQLIYYILLSRRNDD